MDIEDAEVIFERIKKEKSSPYPAGSSKRYSRVRRKQFSRPVKHNGKHCRRRRKIDW